MKVYTYNDKVLVNSANDKWLKEKEGPAPIVLPPYTIRIKLIAGSTAPTISGASVTPVNGMADVYDVCTATAGRGTIWGAMLTQANTGGAIIEEIIAINALDVNNANPATVQELFADQVNVKSGILNAYNYLSSTVTTYNNMTFKNCGSNTVTGAAELAQIPSSWGGTGA